MNFRQLEFFAAVVKAGSVSQAARNLGVSQPPLSTAITRLEQEAGVQLLVRSAQGVRLTPAGRYLLNHGSALVASRDRMARVLRLMGAGLVGELRLAAEPMVIHEVIGEALLQFAVEAPDSRVTLNDVEPRVAIDGVAAGLYDIGCIPFAPKSISRAIVDRFEWVELSRIDVKLAVPNSRAKERHEAGRGWGRWILPHAIPGMPGMIDAVEAHLAGDSQFDTVLVSTPQTAIPLVAAGLGVAPTTRRIWGQRPGVSVIDGPSWLLPMQVTVFYRKGIEVSPLMERWIEIVRRVSTFKDGRPQHV